MFDIKMSEVFHLPMECASSKDYTGIQCTELADNDFFLADFRGEWSLEKANEMAEAAAHAINNHDDLVKKVAELKKALIEVSEQTIDLFAYTIDEVNYYTGLISDCLVNDEVGTIRTMVKVALKESE